MVNKSFTRTVLIRRAAAKREGDDRPNAAASLREKGHASERNVRPLAAMLDGSWDIEADTAGEHSPH